LSDQNVATAFFFQARQFDSRVHTRLAQSFEQCICDFVGIWLRGLLWSHGQAAYDFPLTLAHNFAIAQKSRQNFLMSKVLAPSFELFGGFTDTLAQLDKGISEAMRVKVQQKKKKPRFLGALWTALDRIGC